MSIRVSVVVPVYNPGGYLEPLLTSIDRQTLDAGEFELILVDDGSTDGTADVLDAWARVRPNAVVVHQENHGWPGQPRNVGIERARGTYVYFVDQDDWLGDRALERLAAYGDENGSDIVIGRMRGVGRPVPVRLFDQSHPRAQIGKVPVETSQTPHKMFRRSFLDEIGLRFPEGRRRLEDHLFVTTAYLRARVISVYSDDDCYFYRARGDGRNSASLPYDPADYYRDLEDVLDVIDAGLPDGDVKDRFLQRWIRIELVDRLRGHGVRDLRRPRRDAFFTEVSRVLQDRIPLSAIHTAPAAIRVSAAIIRTGTAADFHRLDPAIRAAFVVASVRSRTIEAHVRTGWRTLAADACVSQLLERIGAPAALTQEVIAVLGEDCPLLPETAVYVAPGGTRTTATWDQGTAGYRVPAAIVDARRSRLSVSTAIGARSAPLSRAARRRQRAAALSRRVVSTAEHVVVTAIGRRAALPIARRLHL